MNPSFKTIEHAQVKVTTKRLNIQNYLCFKNILFIEANRVLALTLKHITPIPC